MPQLFYEIFCFPVLGAPRTSSQSISSTVGNQRALLASAAGRDRPAVSFCLFLFSCPPELKIKSEDPLHGPPSNMPLF
ncbi:hypothetical protein M431DRAFT_301116 [Trichoderma harzianum CBS 226.95]|uniref:Uncharacterized protein n=1 Tax=Trichoderma harzianum CBS 226.95 TaxID=983964 RepID=A0A2T4AQK9_TRIHA|nr:hypothetical protein M431DRAFT_301116 [Trichoderma harzianum CBS 226.95]PTB59344.1 hypothetical protein M431DRAFT_301116 [Trichoderma harzianum CBS 226.95]